MTKLTLIVLFLMSLGMEVNATCLHELDSRLSREMQSNSYSYHGLEFREGADLDAFIGESEQLSLAQKREIKKYAASGAVELYLMAASNHVDGFFEIVVANNSTCEILREFRLL
jgi:hypothetical protein